MQLAMSPGWNCQYIQITLGNTARHDEIFTPPTEWQGVKRDWKRFDYVFDFSGETGFDKAELVSEGMREGRRSELPSWAELGRAGAQNAPGHQDAGLPPSNREACEAACRPAGRGQVTTA